VTNGVGHPQNNQHDLHAMHAVSSVYVVCLNYDLSEQRKLPIDDLEA
jgi:hypothetical protein